MKKTLIFMLGFLLLTQLILFCNSVGAVTVDSNTVFQVGNQNYSFANTIDLSQVKVSNSEIQFNDTTFVINSETYIDISITKFNSSMFGKRGDTVLEFTATTAGSYAVITVDTFIPNHYITLNRDGKYHDYLVADGAGQITITELSWSTHTYAFVLGSTYSINGTTFTDNLWNTTFGPFTLLFQQITGHGNLFFLIPFIVLTVGLYFKTRKPVIPALFMITGGALLGSGSMFIGAIDIAIAFYVFAALGFTSLIMDLYFKSRG